MLRLLERTIANLDERLVLLAPAQATLPMHFGNVTFDDAAHRDLVQQMQQLRGRVYLEEGNLRPEQLTADGRHETPEDARSWHLLMRDPEDGTLHACAWYMEHDASVSLGRLRLRHCPLTQLGEWGSRLRRAVQSEITTARRDHLSYAEVGGWAVSRDRRCKLEGVLLALAAFSLSRALGGALGITTANVKHASSSILRRIGGDFLRVDGEPIPAYFDEHYNADIEIIRFDSRRPAKKFLRIIDMLRDQLSSVAVVAGAAAVELPAARVAAFNRRPAFTPDLVPSMGLPGIPDRISLAS